MQQFVTARFVINAANVDSTEYLATKNEQQC